MACILIRFRVLTPLVVGAAFLEPASHCDVAHTKWNLAMVEEIAALEHTGMWDLVSLPLCVRPVTFKGSTRLRLALMVPLCITKLVLWLVAFRRSMVLITIRLFAHVNHMTTVRTFATYLYLNLMLRTSFLMMSYVRRFTCSHHLGILFLMTCFIVLVTP